MSKKINNISMKKDFNKPFGLLIYFYMPLLVFIGGCMNETPIIDSQGQVVTGSHKKLQKMMKYIIQRRNKTAKERNDIIKAVYFSVIYPSRENSFLIEYRDMLESTSNFFPARISLIYDEEALQKGRGAILTEILVKENDDIEINTLAFIWNGSDWRKRETWPLTMGFMEKKLNEGHVREINEISECLEKFMADNPSMINSGKQSLEGVKQLCGENCYLIGQWQIMKFDYPPDITRDEPNFWQDVKEGKYENKGWWIDFGEWTGKSDYYILAIIEWGSWNTSLNLLIEKAPDGLYYVTDMDIVSVDINQIDPGKLDPF